MKINNVATATTMGARLKFLRLSKGLKQHDVSDAIYTSEKNYGKYERDIITPTIDKIIDLADFFGVSTDYLLLGTNPNSGIEISEHIEKCPRDKRDALLEIVRLFVDSVSNN